MTDIQARRRLYPSKALYDSVCIAYDNPQDDVTWLSAFENANKNCMVFVKDAKYSRNNDHIIDPKPFSFLEKNTSNRDAIKTHHAHHYKGVSWLEKDIDNEAWDEIFKMSDDICMHEEECLRFMLYANFNKTIVKMFSSIKPNDFVLEEFEKIATLPYNTIEPYLNTIDKSKIALELAFQEKMYYLDILYKLMLIRNAAITDNNSRMNAVITYTNELLDRGLAKNLISCILSGIKVLQKCERDFNNSNNTTDNRKYIHHEKKLEKLSEIIFLIFFRTQADAYEEELTLKTIKEVATLVVKECTGTGTDPSYDEYERWSSAAYKVIATLQLTHVCMFESPSKDDWLLSRRENSFPFRSKDKRNTLYQTFKAGPLHTFDNDEEWKLIPGIAAFARLPMALGRIKHCMETNRTQPDLHEYSIAKLLQDASKHRAYSYIRLCLLPVLQSSYCNRVCSVRHHLIDVLNDLLINLFDLAFVHFQDHIDFNLICNDGLDIDYNDRVGDYLDDILYTYSSVCIAYPRLAKSLLCDDTIVGNQLSADIIERRRMFVNEYLLFKCFHVDDEMSALLKAGIHMLYGLARNDNYDASLLVTTAGAGSRMIDCPTTVYRWLKATKLRYQNGDDCSLFEYMEDIILKIGRDLDLRDDGNKNSRLKNQLEVLTADSVTLMIPIFDLLSGLCQCNDYGNSENEIGAEFSIQKLFSLLSCQYLPIDLRGSIFNLLAALAHSRPIFANEVLTLLEQYKVVAHLRQFQSLQAELDEGRYPVIDSFLNLLQSILCHPWPNSGEYQCDRSRCTDIGVKDSDGVSRGITNILEYVINEVIEKIKPDGSYNYKPDNITGEGQLWRLKSKGIRLLVTVVQHYGIMGLPDLPLADLTNSDDPNIRMYTDDFVENTSKSVYNSSSGSIAGSLISMQQKQRRVSRHKSPGFIVMSLLLGRSALFNEIKSVLDELTTDVLHRKVDEMVYVACEDSVKLMHKMKESFNVGSRRNIRRDLKKLSEIGLLGDSRCDGAFWCIKTVVLSLGLIYEVCMREKKYLMLLKYSSEPLKIVWHEIGGRQTLIPVFVQTSISNVLLEKIHKIANYLSLDTRMACYPTIPVLAARIIEHVSSQVDTSVLLHTIKQDVASMNEVRRSCTDAIAFGHDSDADVIGDLLELSMSRRHLLPIGVKYDPTGILDIFSESAISATFTSVYKVINPINLYSIEDGSIKESMLLLLLNTLNSSQYCLVHVIIGYSEYQVNKHSQALVQSGKVDPINIISDYRFFYVPYSPVTCLDAVIDLLLDDALIEHADPCVLLCFELLHRLCVSPASCILVLDYLRRIEISKDRSSSGSSNAKVPFFAYMLDVCNRILHKQLSPITRAYVANCTAHLLKIIAVELRVLSFGKKVYASSGSAIERANRLFIALYQTDMQVVAPSSWEASTIEAILQSNVSADEQSQPPSIQATSFAPIIKELLQMATVPHFMSSFDDIDRVVANTSTQLTTIDVSIYETLVKNRFISHNDNVYQDKYEYKLVMEYIYAHNDYVNIMASQLHLFKACNQVLSITFADGIFMGWLQELVTWKSSDPAKAMVDIAEQIIIPTLYVFSRLQYNAYKEAVSKGLLIMIHSILIKSKEMSASAVTSIQHKLILNHLVVAIVQANVDRGSSDVRAYIYSCISTMLHVTLLRRNDEGGTFKSSQREVLEQCRVEIFDMVGYDACNSVTVIDRLKAIDALSSIIGVLSNVDDNVTTVTSPQLLRVFHIIEKKGYLHQLISEVASSSSSSSSSSSTDTEYVALVPTILQLLCHVASCDEGVRILLNCGIIERINSMQAVTIMSFTNELTNVYGYDEINVSRLVTDDFSSKYMPILKLLNTMASVYPKYVIAHCCAVFIAKNMAIVTYLLRMKARTLKCMEITDATICLCCMIATTANSITDSTRNSSHDYLLSSSSGVSKSKKRGGDYSYGRIDGNSSSSSDSIRLWDKELVSYNDSITKSICHIIEEIGSDPYIYSEHGFVGSNSMDPGLWWLQLIPISDEDRYYESVLVGRDTMNPYTLFDRKKYDIAIKILTHASAFLRIRCCDDGSSTSSSDYSGIVTTDSLLALHFDIIAKTLSKILHNCNHSAGSSSILTNDNTSITLSSNSSINDIIIENLMIVLYELVAQAHVQQLSKVTISLWRSSLYECLNEMSKYPSHTFITIVSKWIKTKYEEFEIDDNEGYQY